VNTIEKAKKLITSPHGFSVESSHDVAKALIAANEVIAFYANKETWGDDDWQIKSVNVAEYAQSGDKARNWIEAYSEE